MAFLQDMKSAGKIYPPPYSQDNRRYFIWLMANLHEKKPHKFNKLYAMSDLWPEHAMTPETLL